MFEKVVVVDARAHMMGRLASVVAKELLNGQHVVLVRCEGINISGSLERNIIKFHSFLRKRVNTNPKQGPFHHRAPSMIMYRVIRGMVPHKTARGEAALARLKVFEGIPDEYQKMKRMVVPDALRATRLRPNRRYCVIGDMASRVGWKYGDLINKMEDARRAKSAEYYAEKKAKTAAHAAAKAAVSA